MRVKYLFLVLILLIGFSGCEDDSSSLEVSQSVFNNVSSEGATLEVDVMSSDAWVVSDNATWCTVAPEKGNGNQKITIKVEANIEQSARTATITVSSDKSDSRKIQLNQDGANISDDEYHYELPVVFHVLYKDKTDKLQYVSQSRLADILGVVNKLYKNKMGSVDMNLTFVLANTDPDGNTLAAPGVDYVQWQESYPIDCDKFMSDESGKYVKYLWNPNKYINVMVYNFAVDDSGSTTLGISHLPFSTKGSTFMEGLNPVESSYLTLSNLRFPYCASINSLYINEQSSGNTYNSADVTVTVAHELGHYLGLHHTFSEDKNGTYDGCIDSDYCKDTPTYNKVYYDEWSNTQLGLGVRDLPTLALRENCMTNQRFTSHNIMDYAFSYSDQFTQNQYDRIRHVLTYSPLIPGPKKGQAQTRSVVEGPLDLPIVVMR